MPLSQEPTIIVDDTDDKGASKSDSQELWDAQDITEDDIAEFTLQATQIATDTLSKFKKRDATPEQVDPEEGPFLASPPRQARSLPQDVSSPVPGPSRPRALQSAVHESGPSSSARYPDSDEDDFAEASRVEGILIGSLDDESAELTPEGPPPTQTTLGSSAANSQGSTSASFTSSKSMPCTGSDDKLGKRRATDEGDASSALPRPKFAKIASESDARVLRTVQSDPSIHRKAAVPNIKSESKHQIKHEPKAEPGVYIISHDNTVQAWFDEYRIPWGVQYEIARGVSAGSWTWEAVTREKLSKLRGRNSDSAPKVAAIMRDKPVPQPSRSDVLLWEELDREQAAINEGIGRGLGLGPNFDHKAVWRGERNWYGGQIQQLCRLQRPTDGPLKLVLGKMEMTRSHRFARFLGSRRLLQIKLPNAYDDRSEEKAFLCRKLVLCGRVFQVFAVKEEKAYAMEVNEDFGRVPCKAEGDLRRLSLEAFVAIHNPMRLNANQPVSKFNARFDLGLSTSRPVLYFDPRQIKIIDDQYAPLEDPRKIPAEKIYTDGCGFMNGVALKTIKDTLGLNQVPCAVQGRIFGSKGVWMLHPDHTDFDSGDCPRIWIRRSQLKVVHATDIADRKEIKGVHTVNFIFDLVAVPRISTNPHLNRHTIVNLHHNGVPASVFEDSMRTGIKRALQPLLVDDGPLAAPWLCHAIDALEGVTRQRALQYSAGAQRVLGLASRNEVVKEEDAEEDANGTVLGELDPAILPPSRYYPGGMPVSNAERLVRLLSAGFSLREEYVAGEREKLCKNVINAIVGNLRLPLSASAEAFMVPDPTGKLQEDEIYFNTWSTPFADSPNIRNPYLLLGDCLLYRNPARLASDIRKVRAVDVPELALYKDVIVVPCKGSVSLPSMLAGGDVDGDTAVCIWDPVFVQPFKNSKLVTVPPDFKEANFQPEGEIVKVKDAWDEITSVPERERPAILQRHLVSGVSASRTGMYSRFHDLAMYMYGYTGEKTQRIALMFNFILDSRKSGMVVRPEVWKADFKDFNYDVPVFMGGSPPVGQNPRYPTRGKGLKPFVIESLWVAAKGIKAQMQGECSAALSGITRHEDVTVVSYWEDFATGPLPRSEIQAVERFVESCRSEWTAIPWKGDSDYESAKTTKKNRNSFDAARRAVATKFNHDLPLKDVPTLHAAKALPKIMSACAYSKSRSFAFGVAFTQLAHIKAEACKIAPIAEEVNSFQSISGAAAKILASRVEVAGGG